MWKRANTLGGGDIGTIQPVEVTLTSNPQEIDVGFEIHMLICRNKVASNTTTGWQFGCYVNDGTKTNVRRGQGGFAVDDGYGITAVTGSKFTWRAEPNKGISGGLQYWAI